ncbi:uncharacterized protein SPPG_06127 [Spizellomyces punctatus DAOM BR117]|uniref:Arrestin C-terminal-like domain-containing protein n=1 Tax=Spizellomyces punctatus (strain DAOM BR117) TaxID=645134 RepID=A0A0L0HCC7_SPIPD|nr:uncharacterized protein SPPG_06127 [Spizellomyces punctatus DAOM BR117]KNC98423.1 hypothetical protein SPPG_06127 [Spizellomyces punctatus DAOM BR117]|eukprot:XP_016606463.1 hypothetical protein SPPG_06127 [Spizellomyces punctatus DAOM BR117]
MSLTASHWHANPLNPPSLAPSLQESTTTPEFDPPSKIRNNACGVHLDVQLDRTIFVAAGDVNGHVVVNVRKREGVKIGRIEVDVVGFEETTAKSQSHRRLLLWHTLPVQCTSLPPSSAVHAGPPDEHGMWLAKKGRHVLDFSIPLEKFGEGMHSSGSESRLKVQHEVVKPLPSSVWCKGEGGVRYLVVVTLHLKPLRSTRPLTPLSTFTPFFLLESLPPLTSPLTRFPTSTDPGSPHAAETTAVVGGKYWFGLGRKGEVSVKASVRVPDDNEGGVGFWVAGSVGFVGLDIENGSERKITDLKLTLIRRLKTFSPSASSPPPNTTTTTLTPHSTSTLRPISFSRVPIAKRTWKVGKNELGSDEVAEEWKGVDRGEKRCVVLDLAVPINARSIRFGMLLDVSYVVQVTIKPRGSTPLCTEIPITILHPASLYQNVPTIQLRTLSKPVRPAPRRELGGNVGVTVLPDSDDPNSEIAEPAEGDITRPVSPTGVASAAEEQYRHPSTSSREGPVQSQMAQKQIDLLRNASIRSSTTNGTSKPRRPATNGMPDRAGTVDRLSTLDRASTIDRTSMLNRAYTLHGANTNTLDQSHALERANTLDHPQSFSQSPLPPENPPSPAARRAAQFHINGPPNFFSSPVMPENEQPDNQMGESLAHDVDDISRTIDKLFEGFPGM